MTGKGRTRPNKRETTAPQEDLSDETGRKFVASIIDDDKHGRLKVLLRGHTKRAVVNYREVDTKLSLLQFACIVGNVHAGKCTLPNSILGACYMYQRKHLAQGFSYTFSNRASQSLRKFLTSLVLLLCFFLLKRRLQ